MLAQYESLFHTKGYMGKVLGLIYIDILKFHHKAYKYFKQRCRFHTTELTRRAKLGKYGSSYSKPPGKRFALASRLFWKTFAATRLSLRRKQTFTSLKRFNKFESWLKPNFAAFKKQKI
jgi:hypothetical protein